MDNSHLYRFFEAIRDEKRPRANTATRIGEAFLMLLDYLAAIDYPYLRKDIEDTAQERITFLKGITAHLESLFEGLTFSGILKSEGAAAGAYGTGIHMDAQTGTISTDVLNVRKKARFAEVEIRRTTWLNAEQVQSAAASRLAAVLPVARSGQVITDRTPDDDEVWAWRCLELADDGTLQTVGGWRAGDQARCQTFNIKEGTTYNAANKYYWRLVVRTGNGYEYEGKTYNWFELATEHGTADPALYYNEAPILFAQLREAYAAEYPQAGDADTHIFQGWERIAGVTLDRPAADDDVVQMGNQVAANRMGFYMSRAEGNDTGPYIYAGVNGFSLAGKMVTKITPAEVLISSKKLKVFSNPNAGDAAPLTRYRGDWTEGAASYYYDEWDYGESRWLYIGTDEPDTEAPGTTADKWKEVSLKGDDGMDAVSVSILSSDGNVIRNGVGECVLTAVVYMGTDDITATLPDMAFSWKRKSADDSLAEWDTAWDQRHVGAGRQITVGSDDVNRHAQFTCEVNINNV